MIAHETGVVIGIDPLGGSYHLEAGPTNRLEEEAYELFRRIDELGGMVSAIEQNMPQREIAEAAYRYQQEIESGERVVVGVNRYRTETTRRSTSSASTPTSSGSRSSGSRHSRPAVTRPPSNVGSPSSPRRFPI